MPKLSDLAPASTLAFCPVLDEIVRRGYAPGRAGGRFTTTALSTVNNLLMLRNMQIAMKAEHTLETGLSAGGSCLVFAQTHKDLGASPHGQHIAIDPYQRGGSVDEAGLWAVERAGRNGYLDFREDFSELALPLLVRENRVMDLIYIDGFHLFENAFVDFYYCARLLRLGGIVLFDDSTNGHVRKVIRFIRTNCAEALQEVDLMPFRSGVSWRYAAARLLAKVQLTGFRKIGTLPRSGFSPFRSF